MTDSPAAGAAPISEAEATRTLEQGITHFNARRYLYAYDSWRTLQSQAPEEERDFFEGLLLATWGLLHLDRRRVALARRDLAAAIEKLKRYEPGHRGLVLDEVLDLIDRTLDRVAAGEMPYLIPPTIKHVDVRPRAYDASE